MWWILHQPNKITTKADCQSAARQIANLRYRVHHRTNQGEARLNQRSVSTRSSRRIY